MIIYLEPREVFLSHVNDNAIDDEVLRRFKVVTGHGVARTEIEAWRESLRSADPVLVAVDS